MGPGFESPVAHQTKQIRTLRQLATGSDLLFIVIFRVVIWEAFYESLLFLISTKSYKKYTKYVEIMEFL